MRLIELNEKGEPRLTKSGLSVPEFKILKELDHTVGKDYFAKQISYIFFVYDKESPYAQIIPLSERQKIVLQDKLSNNALKDFEGNQKVFDAINKFKYLEFTVNERVYNRCIQKFGEFKILWSETPVSHESFEQLGKEFNSVNGLFATMEKLEKLIRKEELQEIKNYGDYKPSFLEEGVFG